MKVGIIGAGLQGRRRVQAFSEFPDIDIVIIAAAHQESAKRLADKVGCIATDNWREVVEMRDVDTVLVCTPTNLHAVMSIAAIERGKHVLCEKPMARTLEEAREILKAVEKHKVKFKCGFNHRHHPGIRQAREWFDKGLIGELNFLRCRYGICGRPNYEREWRARLEIAGGGQLMEQGIHAIDLFRWFLGDFTDAVGFVATRYWNIAPLEDNAFALFRTERGQIASLHASLTQWKNLFSFELFGQDGYIVVEGLGGSYGTESASLGSRAWLGPFEGKNVEFRGEDPCWREEWKEFVNAIHDNREPMGSGHDGYEALRMVQGVYESAAKGCVQRLTPSSGFTV